MKRVSSPFPYLVLVLFFLAPAPGADSKPFDPAPWVEDLSQVREVLATKYANLEWAVFQREADLPNLFADTKARVERASNETEARAAFDRFARKLGDEHVVFVWPSNRQSNGNSASTDPCAAYNPAVRAAPLAANAHDYQPISNAYSGEFPAGIIVLKTRRIGILQIGVFTPRGFPALCREALQALSISADKQCDDACSDRIESWASDRLTRDLIGQIRALENAGSAILLVDIAGNGGGTEWAEAVARMLTPIRLRSENMGFARGEHWGKQFAEMETSLREFAQHETGADQALLLQQADEVKARERVAMTPCDSAPFWHGAHPECSWLGNGFYGSGLLPSADPARLRGKPWATTLFTPMEFPYEEGLWRGPLIVLVDRAVGSAASEFAAVLQDNRAAIIMGEPAGGGCGHTNGGTPTTLRNSKAVLEVPDCARFRADDSNEVLGIQPDVPVAFAAADGPHLRADRFLARLPDAVNRLATLDK